MGFGSAPEGSRPGIQPPPSGPGCGLPYLGLNTLKPINQALKPSVPGSVQRPLEGEDVGTVALITADGTVILRGREVPEGTLVESPHGRFIGRVTKVFGPVRRPYLSVRPRKPMAPGDLLRLMGQSLSVRGRG